MSFIQLQTLGNITGSGQICQLDSSYPQAVFALDIPAGQNITVSKLQFAVSRASTIAATPRVRAFIRPNAGDSTYKSLPTSATPLATTISGSGLTDGWFSAGNFSTATPGIMAAFVEDFPFQSPVTLQAGTRYTIHVEFDVQGNNNNLLKFYGSQIAANGGSHKITPNNLFVTAQYSNLVYYPFIAVIGNDSTSVYEIGSLDYTTNYRSLSTSSTNSNLLWHSFIPAQTITFNQLTAQMAPYDTSNPSSPFQGSNGPSISVQIYQSNQAYPYAPSGTALGMGLNQYVKDLPNTQNYAGYANALSFPIVQSSFPYASTSVTLQAGTRYTILFNASVSNSQYSIRLFSGNGPGDSYIGNNYTSGYSSTGSWAPYIDFDSVYQPMTNVSLSSSSVAENTALSTVIGALSTTGGTSPYTYTFSGGLADNGAFAISGSNLVVNTALNYETKSSYSIQVSSTDATSAVFNKSLTISVTNVNEAPTDITLSNSSIAELAGTNAVVGTLSATDPEGGAMTYTLVAGTGDTHNSLFNIINTNSLVAKNSFDYENMPSGAIGKTLSVRVRATDSTSLTFDKAFTITVTNVNEAPTNITLSNSSITENNATNAVIGTLSVTDPDIGDSVIFSIPTGMGNDKFNISGTSLRATAVFDYETATSHSVTVRATDGGGLTYDKAFTISILNDISDDTFPLTSANSVTLPNDILVASVTVDPTVIPVLKDGNALPDGSIIKYTVTGQKFIKVAGSNTSYESIPVTPPAGWNWDQNAIDAWAVLQNL